MRGRAEELVYLSTKTYASLEQITKLILVFAFTSLLSFGYCALTNHMFISVLVIAFFLLYSIYVICLRSKHVVKTFRLRFLTNGIGVVSVTIFIPVTFLLCACIIETTLVKMLLPIVLLYALYVVLYIALIIVGVHKNIFAKIRKFNKMPIVVTITSITSALLPLFVALGMLRGMYLREILSDNQQVFLMFIIGVALLFICAIGYINFVQYFYCVKYSIDCDEDGDTTSPKLMSSYKATKGTSKH